LAFFVQFKEVPSVTPSLLTSAIGPLFLGLRYFSGFFGASVFDCFLKLLLHKVFSFCSGSHTFRDGILVFPSQEFFVVRQSYLWLRKPQLSVCASDFSLCC